ncbi:hypothetical protein DDT91_02725 [Algoriphagus sp. AK58]|nr:DUF4221 family protein [Algoriphagus sp. AK58]MBC6365691.1 hypothetical protein [Algoriphagus sp. AK58]
MFLLAPLIFSCGGNSSEKAESGNILENLSFTVDTVLVDPGEELINLASGLRLADFSPDKKKLYLLNGVDQSLAVIDMEVLKLSGKNQFEAEGPNGIGNYHNRIQILSGDRMYINSFQSNAIFNFQGIKEETIKILAENIDSLSIEDEQNAWYGLMLSKDEKKVFSLPGNFFEGGRNLLVADFPSLKGKVIQLPATDLASNLRVILKSKEMMSVSVQEIFLQEFNGKIIIGNSASSDVYQYDYVVDSLELKTYQHVLVPNRKEVSVKAEVESQEEFQAEMDKINQQIAFQRFFEDPEMKRYYRFGKINLPKPSPDAEQKEEVFLFAYDRDFNLIGESRLKELTKVPQFPFFKDGKLWSYVNVEDELGFAVFDLSF